MIKSFNLERAIGSQAVRVSHGMERALWDKCKDAPDAGEVLDQIKNYRWRHHAACFSSELRAISPSHKDQQ